MVSIFLIQTGSICPTLTGAGDEKRIASEKGPVSLDKSEVSILHQQHGFLVVWGAGGTLEESPGHQVLCDQDWAKCLEQL